MTQLATDILTDLVHRKRACLAQLCELGLKQQRLIAAGEMSDLLKVLSGKQRLLGELQTIETALDPFRDDDPDERVWRSPADRQRCAGEVSDCERLLAAILDQERGSEVELRRRRDETQQRLQGTHDAALARGAYRIEAPVGTHQLDLTSDI